MAHANRIAHRLRAGTVWINCYNIFDAATHSAATSNRDEDTRWDTRRGQLPRDKGGLRQHI